MSRRLGAPCDPSAIIVGHRVSDGAPLGLVMLLDTDLRRSDCRSPVRSTTTRPATNPTILRETAEALEAFRSKHGRHLFIRELAAIWSVSTSTAYLRCRGAAEARLVDWRPQRGYNFRGVGHPKDRCVRGHDFSPETASASAAALDDAPHY